MTEPASSPKTKYGKAMIGFFTGVFAFFICAHGASPAGIFFAIILGNIISPLIERLEIKIQAKKGVFMNNSNVEKIKKHLLLFAFIAAGLILWGSGYIISGLKNDAYLQDADYILKTLRFVRNIKV